MHRLLEEAKKEAGDKANEIETLRARSRELVDQERHHDRKRDEMQRHSKALENKLRSVLVPLARFEIPFCRTPG